MAGAKGGGTYYPYKRKGKLTGRWCGQITVDNVTWTCYRDTKEACVAACQSWATAQRRRRPSPDTPMSYGEFLELWFDAIASDIEPSSLVTYRWAVTKLPAKLVATRLDQLPRRELQFAVTQISKTMSPSSARTVRAVINKSLNDAVDWEYIDHHAAHRLRLGKGETPEATAWTDDECQTFLDVADSHPWRVIWWITVSTGLRNSEARALRWEDINRTTGAIRVRRKLDEAARTVSQPKGRRLRTVSVRGQALRAIQDDSGQRTGYVVSGDDGEPVTGDRIRDELSRLIAASGVTPINFHGLRHTAITQMLLSGVALHVVSKIAGHSSPTITAKVYAHVLNGDAERAAEAMAARLSKPRRTSETA